MNDGHNEKMKSTFISRGEYVFHRNLFLIWSKLSYTFKYDIRKRYSLLLITSLHNFIQNIFSFLVFSIKPSEDRTDGKIQSMSAFSPHYHHSVAMEPMERLLCCQRHDGSLPTSGFPVNDQRLLTVSQHVLLDFLRKQFSLHTCITCMISIFY